MQKLYAQEIYVTERTKLNESFCSCYCCYLNLDVCLLKKYIQVVFTKTTQKFYCSTLSNDMNCMKKKRTPCILL